MELFRWIVDLSVIQLLESTPKIKKSYFIITENYHIRLKDSIASLLINKIKDNFKIKAPYKGKNYYYDIILSDNISKINKITSSTHLQVNKEQFLLIFSNFFSQNMVSETSFSLEPFS